MFTKNDQLVLKQLAQLRKTQLTFGQMPENQRLILAANQFQRGFHGTTVSLLHKPSYGF